MTEEEFIKLAAIPMPKPQDEISVLLRKHDLCLTRVKCSGFPHIVGIGSVRDICVCGLWQMSTKNSRRKIKKAIKKFLRNYDKQNK